MIGDLAVSSMYTVDEVSDHTVGPLGGPMKQEWSFDPKPKFDAKGANRALQALLLDWNDIAGPQIGPITSPLRLTGAKRRRLLVLVKANGVPPWGTWEALREGEGRRAFTQFRAAINRTIAPHEVDHVDFVLEPTKGEI